jgi:hypothetical protein
MKSEKTKDFAIGFFYGFCACGTVACVFLALFVG